MWEVPLATLCLLRRQEGIRAGTIFPLQVVEEIDGDIKGANDDAKCRTS